MLTILSILIGCGGEEAPASAATPLKAEVVAPATETPASTPAETVAPATEPAVATPAPVVETK